MLYSTNIKINDIEYIVKLGMKELIKLEDEGIKLQDFADGQISFKNIMKIMFYAVRTEIKSFDEFLDFIDNSNVGMEDLSKVLEIAIDKGINKGKNEKNVQTQMTEN
jgi:hypothetical protein